MNKGFLDRNRIGTYEIFYLLLIYILSFIATYFLTTFRVYFVIADFHIHFLPFVVFLLVVACYQVRWLQIISVFIVAFSNLIITGFGNARDTVSVFVLYIIVGIAVYFAIKTISSIVSNRLLRLFYLFSISMLTMYSSILTVKLLELDYLLTIHKIYHFEVPWLTIIINSLIALLFSAPLIYRFRFMQVETFSTERSFTEFRRSLIVVLLGFAVIMAFGEYSNLQDHLYFAEREREANLSQESRRVLEAFGRSYSIYTSILTDDISYLSKLLGAQWRIKTFLPQRLSIIFTQNSQYGVESCFLLEEDSSVEFFAGLKPDDLLRKKIARNIQGKIPLYPEKNKQTLLKKLYLRHGEKLYKVLIAPVYRTEPNPLTGESPDYKRNGYVVSLVDYETFLKKVQKASSFRKVVLFNAFVDEDGKISFVIQDFPASFSYDDQKKIIAEALEKSKRLIKAKREFFAINHKEYYLYASVHDRGKNIKLVSGVILDSSEGYRMFQNSLNHLRVGSFWNLSVLLLVALAIISYMVAMNYDLEKNLEKKEKERLEAISGRFEVLDSVISNFPLVVILLDESMNIKLKNIFADVLLEKLKEKNISFAETPFIKLVAETFESGLTKRKEIIIGGRIFGTTASFLQIENEKFVILVLSDITEFRKMQQAAIIESRNLLISSLTRDLSYYLNEYLQVAYLNTELALTKSAGNSQVAESLMKVKESLDNFNRLSRSITYLSGGMTSKNEPVEFDITMLVTKAVEVLMPVIKEYSIETDIITERKLGVYANPDRVDQVLLTILQFSIDHLSVVTAPRKLKVSFEETPESIVVRIHNNGPPFSEELKESIFSQFYTERKTGLGFGLFIARELAQYDGGKISLESSDEWGVIFVIEYPKTI